MSIRVRVCSISCRSDPRRRDVDWATLAQLEYNSPVRNLAEAIFVMMHTGSIPQDQLRVSRYLPKLRFPHRGGYHPRHQAECPLYVQYLRGVG